MKDITSFSGRYSFLSNFHFAPVEFEGSMYPTSEHAFQAAKTTNEHVRKAICNQFTPGDAKRMGRRIKLRDDWEDIKFTTMYKIVKDKFTRTPSLGQSLVDTGDAYLEEGNTWGDKYWGTVSGVGENNLGKILMVVRDELRREQAD